MDESRGGVASRVEATFDSLLGEEARRLATVGTTRVKSSCALVGLAEGPLGCATSLAGLAFRFWGVTWGLEGRDAGRCMDALAGVVRGDETGGADLLLVNFDGVGRLDSLAVAAWPCLGRGTTVRFRLGDVSKGLGVTAAGLRARMGSDGGLCCSDDGPSWLRIEYGPAVAGRAAISGRILAGRFGALVNPPEATARVDSGLVLTPAVVVGLAGAVEAVDTVEVVRTGENWAMAEPGRAGKPFLALAIAARF